MKKLKISLVLNIIIFILTLVAVVIMFTGFKFMKSPETLFNVKGVKMFLFFTVDSNMFMGLVALIYAYYEHLVLKKKIEEIPRLLQILKLMCTTAIVLTFVVVFVYLIPIAKNEVKIMLMNGNFFFHLIIPVLSIITYVFFEKNNLKKKDIIYGLIPTLTYSCFYLINVLIHFENGKVSPEYDWYSFAQNGIFTSIIILSITYILTYLISFVLLYSNNKLAKE